jgi:hypothetical protein
MKITTEFVLPEEGEEYRVYLVAPKIHAAFVEFAEHLRRIRKYDVEVSRVHKEAAHKIEIEFLRFLNERKVRS